MRIIKLSPNDPDMINREMVNFYFNDKLRMLLPLGQFLLTEGRISKNGISPGEMLVFSYLGEIVYLAISQTKRIRNTGNEFLQYPYYFCIDTETIVKGKGTLQGLENEIKPKKNFVKSQGWPTIKDSDEIKIIWDRYKAR
jgi:hypothetical protein